MLHHVMIFIINRRLLTVFFSKEHLGTKLTKTYFVAHSVNSWMGFAARRMNGSKLKAAMQRLKER